MTQMVSFTLAPKFLTDSSTILTTKCVITDNMEYRNVVEKEFLFQTINNGAFSVDTFFFIRWVTSFISICRHICTYMIQAVVNHYFSKDLFQCCGKLQVPGQAFGRGGNIYIVLINVFTIDHPCPALHSLSFHTVITALLLTSQCYV